MQASTNPQTSEPALSISSIYFENKGFCFKPQLLNLGRDNRTTLVFLDTSTVWLQQRRRMTPTAGALGDVKASTVTASPKSPKISLKERKKRTSNPGIRQQGGRIYDSENGTTCHQCRQKTIEIKAKCKQCTLYFCPRCLKNRYNEAVDEVNTLPDWSCPRCRKLCNCSNCRKKAGLEATGILAKVAKTAGFGSVSELLKKNPQAQAFRVMTGAAAIGDGSAVFGSISRTTPGCAQPKSATKKRKVQSEEQLLDDSQLSPRKIAMPQGVPIALYKRSNGRHKERATSSTPLPADASPRSQATPRGGGGSAKRQRGPAWLDKVPDVASLPTDVDPGQIACILEFISVFGTSILNFRSLPNLAALGTELVQPACTRRIDQICPIPEDSIAAMVHMKLLDVVRRAWEVVGPSVSLAAWQQLMRPYYAAEVISPEAAAVLRDEYGPSAVYGELFSRRVNRGDGNAGENEADEHDVEDRDGAADDREFHNLQRGGNTTIAAADDNGDINGRNTTKSNTNESNSSSAAYLAAAAAASAIQFPEGGFWGIAPGLRIQMLYTLLHDALDTFTVRQVIEKSMENAAEEEKGRRSVVADVRREAKEAATKQRDQEIALLVAAGGSKQMTLEEQRALMNAAREKAEHAATAAAAAKLKSLSQMLFPPTVRSAPLGQDREGFVVFKLQTSAVLTGNTNGLIFCGRSTASDAATTNNNGILVAQGDPAKVVAALDPRGKSEGPLRHAIAAACKVSLTSSPGRKKYLASPSSEKKQLQITMKSPAAHLGGPADAGGGGGGGTSGSKKRAMSGTPTRLAMEKTPAATLNGKVLPALKTPKSAKK
jgi:hypothetical protein